MRCEYLQPVCSLLDTVGIFTRVPKRLFVPSLNFIERSLPMRRFAIVVCLHVLACYRSRYIQSKKYVKVCESMWKYHAVLTFLSLLGSLKHKMPNFSKCAEQNQGLGPCDGRIIHPSVSIVSIEATDSCTRTVQARRLQCGIVDGIYQWKISELHPRFISRCWWMGLTHKIVASIQMASQKNMYHFLLINL